VEKDLQNVLKGQPDWGPDGGKHIDKRHRQVVKRRSKALVKQARAVVVSWHRHGSIAGQGKKWDLPALANQGSVALGCGHGRGDVGRELC